MRTLFLIPLVMCGLWVVGLTFLSVESGAVLAEDKLDPLELFAREFVEITPGQGKFPASFQMGSSVAPQR